MRVACSATSGERARGPICPDGIISRNVEHRRCYPPAHQGSWSGEPASWLELVSLARLRSAGFTPGKGQDFVRAHTELAVPRRTSTARFPQAFVFWAPSLPNARVIGGEFKLDLGMRQQAQTVANLLGIVTCPLLVICMVILLQVSVILICSSSQYERQAVKLGSMMR